MVGVTKDKMAMVSEYCDGGALSRVGTSKMSMNQKIALLEQVRNGLSYIHSKQVMHRDIKSNNIFLTLPLHVQAVAADTYPFTKIGDFGLALHFKEAIAKRRRGKKYWQPGKDWGGDVVDIFAFA